MKLPTQAFTVERKAHFLAQCDHESMGFKRTVENLNYSAKALLLTFPKYYKSLQEAQEHERNPMLIANKVYGGRMGNNTINDGYTYRGRGYIQLTGKSNYQLFSKYINDDCVKYPDLVADKYALESAAWYFDVCGIWSVCDRGITHSDIAAVTRIINGGTNGLAHRIELTQKYYNELKRSNDFLENLLKNS